MVAQPVAQPRAAVYIRVSTVGQEESGTSLQSQEEACRRFAAERGYILDEAHVYREVHTGTELWERPELTKLREAVRRKKVGVVVAYAIDRLARDPVHLGVLITEADHAGAAVEFVSEPLDNSPEGQLIRFVRGYAAKVEHEKIRERNLRGKRSRLEAGKINNYGTDRYGYRRDRDRGVRVIHEAEAATVRRIFEWVAVDGCAIRAVAARLNADGVPTPAQSKGSTSTRPVTGRWFPGPIRGMLRDASYKGDTYAWRLPTVDPSQWLKLPEGTTPAIVSAALWQAANDRLDANRGDATRNVTRPYLLRGRIFCAVCGRRMGPIRTGNGFYYYKCLSRAAVAGPCGARQVSVPKIEAWVWEYVCSILRDPSLITREVERRRRQGPDKALTANLETARQALAALDKQQAKMVRAFSVADDAFPVDLLQREMARVQAERSQVQATVQDLQRRLTQQDAACGQLEALHAYCDRVAARLDAFTFAEKRLALEALAVRVTGSGKEWCLDGAIRPDGECNKTDCLPKEAARTVKCVSRTADLRADRAPPWQSAVTGYGTPP